MEGWGKLGSKAHPCYIRIRVITNRVISRFKCIYPTSASTLIKVSSYIGTMRGHSCRMDTFLVVCSFGAFRIKKSWSDELLNCTVILYFYLY